MTTMCFAPTPTHPRASFRRLSLLGGVGGLVLGGPVAASFFVVSAIVGQVLDPVMWSSSDIPGAVTLYALVQFASIVVGVVIGFATGIAAFLIGRLDRGRRRGVALGAFATAAILSYEPIDFLAAGQSAVTVSVTVAVAVLAAWIMTLDRFPPRRSTRRGVLGRKER